MQCLEVGSILVAVTALALRSQTWPYLAMFSCCFASFVQDQSGHETVLTDLPDENRNVSCETHKVWETGVAPHDVWNDSEASVSTAASSFDEEVGTEHEHRTLKLSFKTPDDEHHAEVQFYSTPLCLRFSKSMPLTVLAVGTEFSGSAPVHPSWVVTHVDEQPLDSDYKYAARQIRFAAKSLPCRHTSCTEVDQPAV